MSDQQLKDWTKVEGYTGAEDLDAFRDLLTDGRTAEEINGVTFVLLDSADNEVGKLTTGEEGSMFDVTELPAGTYKIKELKNESTYIGPNGELLTGSKAADMEIELPMYKSEGGILETVHIYPKNSQDKPEVEKKFEDGESADEERSYDVGDKVPYEVNTTIPANTEYETAYWDDQMTKGLTFNNDVKVFIGGVEIPASEYDVTISGNGFRVVLNADGLDRINKQTEPTKIRITYSATLNEDAVVQVPESNDVVFVYGNNPSHGNAPVPTETDENGEIKVTKTWEPSDVSEDVKGEYITFTLYNAQSGEMVVFDDNQENPIRKTIQEILDGAEIKWTGLEKGIQYKVVETYPAGYVAEYGTAGPGVITITNWKEDNPPPINPPEPKVYTGGKKWIKLDPSLEEDENRLAGAKFIVKKVTDGTTYYMVRTGNIITWTDDEDAATPLISNDQGQISVEGLQYSTEVIKVLKRNAAGEPVDANDQVVTDEDDFVFEEITINNSYSLIEIEAPEGYALIKGEIPFEISENSYTVGSINYELDSTDQDATIIENNKVTIPETGGIGSLIFVVAGLAIMGATLVIKRRRNATQM